MSPDKLSEEAPMHTPYRFAFNNPVFWSDPTGLYEYDSNGNLVLKNKNEIAFYNDYMKNGGNVNNFETALQDAGYGIDLQEATVKAISKESDNTLENIGLMNDRIGDSADILSATKNKGGSISFWTKTIDNRAFDGINYGEIRASYYANNWKGNRYRKTYNISKVLKRGTIVTTAVLGTIEIGSGVSQDYQNYQNTGYTDGKNTAVATASVAGGVAGGIGGAAIGAAVGVWFGGVGAAPGALIGGIIGGALGSWGGSELAESAVQKAYE